MLDEFFIGGEVESRLQTQLKDLDVVFHSVPQQEPDTDTVESAHAKLADSEADLIIAVGGGSAMDTAKVARMLLANPGPVENISGPVGVFMKPHHSLFICVPTTAGTGSEVSESAIVAKSGTDYKMVFRSSEMSARIALLDPELSTSAPPSVTAASGYDAMTHAVEAYTSKAAGPMTDPFAYSAIRLLARALPEACHEPNDINARGNCLVASMQAGIAFNSAHLGLSHAIAGALGALNHVPHGLANALALPWTTAFNEPELGRKGADIATLLDADSAAAGLSRLRYEINLDISLDEWVTSDEARDAVAAGSMKSGQIRVNPRSADEQQVRKIIEAMRTPTAGNQPQLSL
ncbi:MAG: alcohol dehydrogenase [marine bacterium B5-7]|nr:MAG: alcohol dehydrogenase [marine bacterium B5-7]